MNLIRTDGGWQYRLGWPSRTYEDAAIEVLFRAERVLTQAEHRGASADFLRRADRLVACLRWRWGCIARRNLARVSA